MTLLGVSFVVHRPSKQMKRAWAPRKLLLGKKGGDDAAAVGASGLAGVQPRIR